MKEIVLPIEAVRRFFGDKRAVDEKELLALGAAEFIALARGAADALGAELKEE